MNTPGWPRRTLNAIANRVILTVGILLAGTLLATTPPASAQTVCNDVGGSIFCIGPNGPGTASTIGGTTWTRPVDGDLQRRIDADIRRGGANPITDPVGGRDPRVPSPPDPVRPGDQSGEGSGGTTFLNDGSGRLSTCNPVGGVLFCN